MTNALRDKRFSNAPSPHAVIHRRNSAKYISASVANNILPFMDPPEHTHPRETIGNAFRRQLDLSPPDMAKTADGILARHRSSPAMELIGDFATPFSMSAICDFIGLPKGDAARLREWSDWFFYLFNPMPSEAVLQNVNRGLAEFRSYIGACVDTRRAEPADDLMSKLIGAKDSGHGLSEAQVVDACMLIFADGIENVDSGIGNCIVSLLEYPDQMELLKQRPGLIDAAVEECLRYNPPAQFIGRIAKEDIEIENKTIRKNQHVLLVLASTNRDPDHFPDPDVLDITRQGVAHMSFGRGRHSCIGAPLVTLELQAALTAIIGGLENLGLGDQRLGWAQRMGHRWLESLPVTYTAR